MGISAPAGFTAGTAPLIVDAVTRSRARRSAELQDALIPVRYGGQRLIDGSLRLTFLAKAPLLNTELTHAFSFFSHKRWPLYVPVAMLLHVPQQRRLDRRSVRWLGATAFVSSVGACAFYASWFVSMRYFFTAWLRVLVLLHFPGRRAIAPRPMPTALTRPDVPIGATRARPRSRSRCVSQRTDRRLPRRYLEVLIDARADPARGRLAAPGPAGSCRSIRLPHSRSTVP